MRTKAKYKNKMASKGKATKKLKDNSEIKQNKRWIFDDEMTACLVECLLSYKVDKEGEGIDFEGVMPFTQAQSQELIQDTNSDQLVLTVIQTQPIVMKTYEIFYHKLFMDYSYLLVIVSGNLGLC